MRQSKSLTIQSLTVFFQCLSVFELSRWSFGGNRLQIKAEERILADIEGMLKTTSSIGASASGSRKSLEPKQELLSILLENERSRLKVWLSPLDVEKKHYLSSGSGSRGPSEVCPSYLLSLSIACAREVINA